MSKRTRREARRTRHRQRRLRSNLIIGAIGVGLVALAGFVIWRITRPAAGEEVEIMPSRDHVPEGTDPGPFNSDPPTSGEHYAVPLTAGFYEEADLFDLGPHPEGYAVHSLEHGYVIFWYNCANAPGGDCDPLKDQLQSLIEEFDTFKVIALPWTSIEEPVVMTSWGQMLRLDAFDEAAARDFISRNRSSPRAPEPNAP